MESEMHNLTRDGKWRTLAVGFTVLFVSCAATAGPLLELRSVDSMAWVARTGPVENATGQIHIYAARNETAAFQVVVSPPPGGALQAVEIELDELAGPGGVVLDEIQLYRQHYVSVTTPSPRSPYAPREYPDALIPFAHPDDGTPLSGALYDAVPFAVTAGLNQPIWGEITVPDGIPAGEYRGTIVATEQGEWAASLPITLTVWDFDLPDLPALKTDFNINEYRVARIHGLDRELEAATVNPIIRSYYDMLLDHLISPAILFDTAPAVDRITGEPDFSYSYPGLGSAAEGLEYYLNQRHASSYSYAVWPSDPFADPLGEEREQMVNYLAGYSRYLARRGWEQRAKVPYGFLDEPDSAEAYDRIRAWSLLTAEVQQHTGIPVPIAVTEQPEPDDTDWGLLDSYVDIWIPGYNAIMLDSWRDEPTIPERLEAGDRIWSYTALSNVPDGLRTPLFDSHPPKWLIDFPPMNYRIPAWLNALYGITGLLYWDTIWWEEGVNVWQLAGNYHPPHPESEGETLNGEGMLIYPGRQHEIGFEGPVASLRLKWIRESIEDFAYIQLLRDNGEWEFAKEQINSFARGVDDWDNDPRALAAARIAMGERIETILRDRQEEAEKSIAQLLARIFSRFWRR